VRRIAGGGKRISCLLLLVKIVVYPFRKLLRKVLYFLSIKDALDTFSMLFHQGYLFHKALEVTPNPCEESPRTAVRPDVELCGRVVLEMLEDLDTGPVGKTVSGVFRTSRDLVRSAVRWLSGRVFSRRSFRQLESEGLEASTLEAASPETKQLLDRLIEALWGEADYRDRLALEIQRRLSHAEVSRA
jgi:hypothetical protein